MTETNDTASEGMNNRIHRPGRSGFLGLSFAWGYIAAFALMIVPIIIFVDNPSTVLDERLELLANLRVLDELADAGIVRDVDVGTGFIKGEPELIALSKRPLAWTLLVFSFLTILAAYLLRGMRQRLLSNHFGIPSSVRGQTSSFFFGRGLNTIFPLGPGELGTAQALVRNGADAKAATTTVFYNRIFEILGIGAFFLIGLVLSGWRGFLTPFFLSLILVVGLTVITRPLGPSSDGQQTGFWRSIWDALYVRTIARAVGELSHASWFMVGLLLLSVIVLGFELAGLYLLKQAFSTRTFFLLGNLPISAFILAIAAASVTRVIPFTPGGMGLYELTMIAVFLLWGGDVIAAPTVAILDGMFTNLIMLLLFLAPMTLRSAPSIVETLRSFFGLSARRNEGLPLTQEVLVQE